MEDARATVNNLYSTLSSTTLGKIELYNLNEEPRQNSAGSKQSINVNHYYNIQLNYQRLGHDNATEELKLVQ
jgi:hypothetical protein